MPYSPMNGPKQHAIKFKVCEEELVWERVTFQTRISMMNAPKQLFIKFKVGDKEVVREKVLHELEGFWIRKHET